MSHLLNHHTVLGELHADVSFTDDELAVTAGAALLACSVLAFVGLRTGLPASTAEHDVDAVLAVGIQDVMIAVAVSSSRGFSKTGILH